MPAELVAAIVLALAYAVTNGLHDAANAIGALVVTRAARPLQAVVLASVFNILGPLILGAAVADTIAGIVAVDPEQVIQVTGAGLAAAVAWNVFTWMRGLPSSSGHALVGGLVGAALVDAGIDAVHWGGLDGWRPVGVFGTLIALALAPALGALAGFVLIRLALRAVRRATRALGRPINAGQWLMSAGLAFSHGSNDAQKAIGVVVALLLADGRIDDLSAPLWVKLGAGAALTVGTAMGGWAIVRTIGRRIYHVRPLDGLVSQASSTAVILGASFAGAPVSTTQVVASSVVGIGSGRARWRHVNWAVVRVMGFAWLATLPASALLAAALLPLWRWAS